MSENDRIGEAFQAIADIDRIIHEPARFMILAILSLVESADFIFLRRQTGLTQGNLSSHLSRLETAGYVNIEKEFVEKIPRTLLSITVQGEKAFNTYQRILQQALNVLGGN